MKNTFVIGTAFVILALFASCASAPRQDSGAPQAVQTQTQTPVQPVQETQPPYRVIDTRTMALGGAIPKWVEAAMESRSKIRELYPNHAVIQRERSGANLDALKFWLDTFDVNTELAQSISTYVKNTAGATTNVADAAKITQAAEAFAATATKAKFSGLSKEGDFWVLKQFTEDGKKEYTYYVLYLMPKALYDQQVDGVLNQLPPAEKAVIQPIVDKAKLEIGDAY